MEKSRIDGSEFNDLMLRIGNSIHVVKLDEFLPNLEVAELIMKSIDIKDAWFLAVGISLQLEGIWTQDPHFDRQDVLRPYTNKVLLDLLRDTEIDVADS